MTREAIPEIDILQRELKDSGGGLWLLANLVVLACTLALIAAISWGVAPVLPPGRRRGSPSRTPRPTSRRRRAAAASLRPPADPEPPARAARPSRSPLALALAGSAPARIPTRRRAAAPASAADLVARPRRRRPSDAASAPAPAGQRIEVQVAGGQVSGDTGRVPVAAGDRGDPRRSPATSPTRCTCTATTWRPSWRPGTPAEITFDATIPGVFEVELHEAGTVLLTLQVA